jgi:glycosyltransferase involved in cell wall biosynthesis
MKVLYFTRGYTPHDRRFLAALAETEHQVSYLRLERRGPQLEDRPLPKKIKQIQWMGGLRPFSWRTAPGLYQNLKRIIYEEKPDLVQSGPLQTAAFLVSMTGFKPLVSMSWGYDLLIDAKRDPIMRWITRYVLQRSTVMIGDCDTVRQKAVSFGMKKDRIFSFPWGVDIEHFSPRVNGIMYSNSEKTDIRKQFGWGKDKFVILSTRGWEPIYGIELIAQSFAKIARERSNLRLLMLSNGSQASKIYKIFSEAEVLDQIQFPGQVGRSDLPRYYQAADLYVSASRSDGSSISLLEAMACGCPVLVSDIPGNLEWIQTGVQGWLFRDGDSSDLGQALLTAVSQSRDRLSEMGKSARTLAEQRANWNNNFQVLLKAYDLAFEICNG